MFQFLFKYSPAVFARSSLVLLGRWPVWLLIAAIAAAAGLLGYVTWWRPARRAAGLTPGRTAVLWLLQASMVALLLLLLWQPAISVSTLTPQQNIISVVLDDSRSMSIPEQGGTRRDQALKVLNSGLLHALQQKYQVRLYRMSDTVQRIDKPGAITGTGNATHIGDSLKQVMAEASSLPVGAVVLLSDGAENSGGIDLATMNDIRRYHIPVHTIGIGRTQFARDVEISDAQTPPRVMTDSRVSMLVSFHQRGYSGQKATITLRDDNRVLASRDVTLKGDGVQQTEPLVFDAGPAGVRNLRVTINPLAGEENANNNSLVRLVNVVSEHPRILYIEGDPRWEFKFIRRAMDDEQNLRLVTMLRTTENKIYRQGIDDPKDLEDGFPATPEELFKYQGLIIGDVSAGYFTPTQLDLIKQFVDRRGGGVLFLGGKGTLADGGYAQSPLADLLPVTLPNRKVTFVRDRAAVELTAAGADSLTTRLEEDPQANVERWKKLPELANYQDVGEPKPGAVVLADLLPPGGRRLPLLVMQNYGRGRTAVLATAGTWRWQMLQPVADRTHEIFWQQLLRWVADSPGHVLSSTPQPVLSDEKQVQLRAEVRDNKYLPVADAQVHAEVTGPNGLDQSVELTPDPVTAGLYTATWTAQAPGGYAANIVAMRGSEELGRDAVMFRREDGVAENFHAEQNRELLQKLSSETGGNYYTPADASRLADEISLSDAGITVRQVRDLWNMPAVFLLLLGLPVCEWFLRRKWGVV